MHDEVNQFPPEKVAILCTGSQGEPMAALSRLSSSNYRDVEILPEDTVILAASPIPGNEKDVSRIVDNLFQLGAKVIYGSWKCNRNACFWTWLSGRFKTHAYLNETEIFYSDSW